MFLPPRQHRSSLFAGLSVLLLPTRVVSGSSSELPISIISSFIIVSAALSVALLLCSTKSAKSSSSVELVSDRNKKEGSSSLVWLLVVGRERVRFAVVCWLEAVFSFFEVSKCSPVFEGFLREQDRFAVGWCCESVAFSSEVCMSVVKGALKTRHLQTCAWHLLECDV